MTKKTDGLYDAEQMLLIRARISKISAALSDSSAARIKHNAFVAKENASNYLAGFGQGDESKLPAHKKAQYFGLKEEAERKLAEAAEADRKMTALETERNELLDKLHTGYIGADTNILIELQKAVLDVEKQLAELTEVLSVKEKEVLAGKKESAVLADLLRQREDLLANLAIGVPVEESQLQQIEKQISEEQVSISETSKIGEQAAAVISGLQRKIAEAEKLLSHKKEVLLQAYSDFLMKETELAGTEFVRLAGMLWKQFYRVAALGKMVEKHPVCSGMTIIPKEYRSFKIPAFYLDTCKTLQKNGYLFEYDESDMSLVVQAAKNDIAKLGVVLPG